MGELLWQKSLRISRIDLRAELRKGERYLRFGYDPEDTRDSAIRGVTRAQALAIEFDTEGHFLWLEQTKAKANRRIFHHLYVRDTRLKAEGRCALVTTEGLFRIVEYAA